MLIAIRYLWEWEITRAGDDERLTMNDEGWMNEGMAWHWFASGLLLGCQGTSLM